MAVPTAIRWASLTWRGLGQGVASREHRNVSSCFGIQGPSPFARRGPFPSTINLTCGRRS